MDVVTTMTWAPTPALEAPSVTVRPTLPSEWERLNEIARHPEVWETMAPDGVDRDTFELNNESLYLAIEAQNLIVGFWKCDPLPCDVWEVHSCLLPEARGSVATAAIPLALYRLFAKTPALTLIGRVPTCLPAARKLATWAGFKTASVSNGTWPKAGEKFDVETLTLTWHEWFFQRKGNDVKGRARALVSSLAVAGHFAKAQFLHATLTTIIGDFGQETR